MPITQAEMRGFILIELVVMGFIFWYAAEVIQIVNYWIALGLNIMNISVVLLLVTKQPHKDNSTGNGGGRKIPPPLVR